MRVYLMSGDMRNMKVCLEKFLSQRLISKFPLLIRFDLLYLSLWSVITG